MTDALDLNAVEARLDECEQEHEHPFVDGPCWPCLLLPAARLVHRQARGCKGCGGRGRINARPIDSNVDEPCHYCAPARAALAAIVGETG